MGNISKKGLYNVLELITAVAAAAVLLLFSCMCLRGRAYMPMEWREQISFKTNGPFFYIAVAAALVLLLACYRFIIRIPGRILFASCSAVFCGAGIFLIINAPDVLRADANSVYVSALGFNMGNYESLGFGGYMYMYPHQLGLSLLWRLLDAAGLGVKAFFAVNLIMAAAANLNVWLTVRLVWGKDGGAANYACLMLFAFFPHLFFVLFAYGLTPGLFFLSAALYFGIRFLKGEGRIGGVLCVIFAVLSCIVRNNNYIGAAAIGVTFVLYAIRDKKPMRLVYPAAMLAAALLLSFIIKQGFGVESGIPVNSGMPKILWVAMGLQDNDWRMDGWSNAYNERTYINCGCDGEAASAEAAANIRERLEYFADNPGRMLAFFDNKIRSTWSEPTFQSLWSGPLEDSGQTVRTGLLKCLYGGGGYEPLNRFGAVLLTVIYLSALAGLVYVRFVSRRQMGAFGTAVCIYLMGGFLFHLLWETKSQYVYPYVYLLIPFAMGVFAEAARDLNSYLCKKM